MFGNFRERLHMVQHDFRSRFERSLPLHFSVGVEMLSRYEESWIPLHKRIKDCAQTAEAVYGDLVMISAHWERRRTALSQLKEQLQTFPAFMSDLDAIATNIAHLEGDFEEMESRLLYLETLCCLCDGQASKHHHTNKLEVYRKKKRRDVEGLEVELNSQYSQKVAELEQVIHQKLRERQKIYEEAFNQDMKNYLSTGYLQHREPLESHVNANALEQMTVADISDQEALDDFLNSTDIDICTGSSVKSVPDLGSCFSESFRIQMHQTSTTNQMYNQDAAWDHVEDEASEENDEPLVQSEEDDIQPHTSFVAMQDVGVMGFLGE